MLPQLAANGIRFLRRGTWNDAQRAWVHDYFKREVLPVLTPIGLDPAHPFPRVFNKSLNLIVELEGRDAFGRGSRVAIVQAPRILPRAIRLPPAIAEGEYSFVYLTSVLHAHVAELFAGMTVKGAYQFRVTRNSDLFVDEEEIKNLRIALQGELLQRHFGDAVRLEVVEEISPAMIEFLLQQFQLDEQDLYHTDGPVNLYRLREVLTEIDRPDLKYPAFTPSVPPPSRWATTTCSRPSRARTSCCTSRTSRSRRCSTSSARARSTRAWSRSSRRCIGRAPCRRSCRS